MSIRIGINPLTWTIDDLPEVGGETSLETCLTEAKAAGFQGVELGCKFPRTAPELRAALAPHGLALVSGWYSTNLLERDAEAEFEAMRPHRELLSALGSDVVVVAETGRLPVDNPATHLELTMIHEAMVLEYAGRDLALVELASSVRLTVLLGLLASLFLPWGISGSAANGAMVGLPLALLAFVVKVTVFAAALGAAEVFIAKLRLFRVPELLAGSFMLAMLAVASSFFLA